MNNVPLEEFIMSQKLSRHPSQYKVAGAHVKLAIKQMKNSASNIRVGDRIPYCIRAGYKGEKISDRAVAPCDIRSGKYVLDIAYYVEKSIRKPITSMLKDVLNVDSLFIVKARKQQSSTAFKRLFHISSESAQKKRRTDMGESLDAFFS
jgi:DNA polymerase elongation subunit (family B)